MNPQILHALLQRGLQLQAEGGELRFRAPKAGLSDDLREQLRSHKNQLLELLPAGVRYAVCSSGQRRLWFEQQLDPLSSAYHVALARLIDGPLEHARLCRAWMTVVARHEALRSALVDVAGEPVQAISARLNLMLPWLDLRRAPEPQSAARQALRQLAAQPLALHTPPLWRAAVLCLTDEQYLLGLVFQHSIIDAASVGIVLEDLRRAYQGIPLGSEPVLQYADFSALQQLRRTHADYQHDLAYWRQRLQDLPAWQLGLAERSAQTGFVRTLLPSALLEDLKQQARQQRATTFMLLLGAFGLLLTRYGAGSELVLGTPVSQREGRSARAAVGFFVNTLPIRLSIPPDRGFADWLAQVREQLLQDFARQQVALEDLIDTSEQARSGAANPLFQVMFAHQERAPHESVSTAAEVSTGSAQGLGQVFDFSFNPSKLDIVLETVDSEQGLACSLQYRTPSLDRRAAQQLLKHWRALLEVLAHDSHTPMARIDFLNAGEKEHLLRALNPPPRAYPATGTIAGEFRRQARLRPDALALIDARGQLSYRALDAASDQLASRLVAAGVEAEQIIALYLPRSVHWVVACLGVLKAGAAYLPLDLEQPPARLQQMVDDCRALFVLSEPQWQASAAALGRAVLLLDDSSPAQTVTLPSLHGDYLAYINYTSGSSGRPKGVAIPQRAVLRLALNSDYVQLTAADRVGQLSNSAFDAITFEVWGALLNGACVEIIERASVLNVDALAQRLQAGAVTTIFLTTALFNTLVREQPAVFSRLKQVLFGGESADPAAIRRLLRAGPPQRLLNVYGPTESTTFASWQLLDSQLPDEKCRNVPIGLPIANTRLYVLDDCLQPVPPGVAGELYIGGDGVCRGYYGQPAASAAACLPDPFSPRAGARMYRSGDWVRRDSAGRIVFLARRDQQLKIRGFRVEPGDLENALQGLPGVRAAAVGVQHQPETSLIAYLVGQPEHALDSHELRARLEQVLPAYLLPRYWVFLNELPLNANGKIDRAALPPPAQTAASSDPPRPGLEQALANLWCEVLQTAHIGRDDSFFELGGHSLKATQLLARLRARLDLDVPVKLLFQQPVLKDFAAALSAARRSAQPSLQPVVAPPVLSHAQRRLWFVYRLNGRNAAYNVPLVLRLHGTLDRAALQRALQAVIRRHQVLRSIIEEQDEPRPRVQALPATPLPFVDLSGLPAAPRKRTRQGLLRQIAGRGFRLETEQPLRSVLCRESEQDHVLALVLHHIACDGWSLGLLLNELGQGYQRGGPEPELTLQYTDFAAWQNDVLDSQALRAGLAYWQAQLQDARRLSWPPPAVDSQRPQHQGAQLEFALPPVLAAQLQTLARRFGISLFMLLLAGFKALLARYSGHTDIVLGSVVAGRTHPDCENLIGFFANTLALRTDLSGNPTVADILRRVQATVLAAFQQQDIPFEQIVEHLGVARTSTETPLFNVMFVLQNAPPSRIGWQGLQLEALAVTTGASKFDVTLAVGESPEGIVGSIEYRTALLDRADVVALLEHWQRVLSAFCADTGQRLGQMSLLPAPALLPSSQGAGLSLPNLTLAELLAERWRKWPQRPALLAAEHSYNYAELAAAVESLAARLQRLGIGPEVPIGLAAARTPELVIAALAVWRAGGVLLPLDLNWPAQRLAWVIRDAGIHQVLSVSTLCMDWPDTVQVLAVDVLAAYPAGAVTAVATPANAAYILYTSGSSGRPKGVVVEQQALLNHMIWLQNAYPLQADDRVLLKTPLSFDAAIWELLAPLLNGATVLLAPAGVEREPALLAGCLRDLQITVAQAVPSVWRYAVETAEAQAGAYALRLLFSGGEALPKALAGKLQHCFGARVINLYGPTEATIDASAAEYKGVSPERYPHLPVGLPISNARAYVLDAWLQPQPPGVAGELYLAGLLLARAYLNQPRLSAARFLPDPFSTQPGQRMYRTGDRVCWRRDGQLQWLGRSDEQIKLRGLRIELGEMEAVLQDHPAVNEAVISMHGEQLIAFVVAARAESCNADILRAFMAEHLPAAWLPQQIVLMPALPRTVSGKLDRRSLAQAPWPDPEQEPVLPLSSDDPLSGTIRAIWQNVLDQPTLAPAADFFALGGHSLLAAQLVARLRAALQIDIPLRLVFDTPRLADFIDAVRRWRALSQDEAPLKKLERATPLPLAPVQQGMRLRALAEPGVQYAMVNALQIDGPLNLALLRRSLNTLAERHEILHTVFPGDAPQQQIVPGLKPLFACVQLLSGQAYESLLRSLAAWSFDITRGPLLRLICLRLHPQRHIWVLAMHHLISDAWSNGLVLRELAMTYQQSAAARPALSWQYADYAGWAQQRLAGQAAQHARQYWRQTLQGAAELQLPLDFPRSLNTDWRGGMVAVRIDAEDYTALDALARSRGMTLFMLLLAGLASVLQHYSGQTDLLLGTDVAGRERVELEPLIGCFVNQLPIRLDISGDPSVQELLSRVQRTLLQAYQHQTLPYEQIVRAVREAGAASVPPLRTKIVLQNIPLPEVLNDTAAVQPVVLKPAQVPFDLLLNLVPEANGLSGAILYRKALFKTSTIQRLRSDYQQVLSRLPRSLEQALSGLIEQPSRAAFAQTSLSRLKRRKEAGHG